jgi:dihydrofolate reductase
VGLADGLVDALLAGEGERTASPVLDEQAARTRSSGTPSPARSRQGDMSRCSHFGDGTYLRSSSYDDADRRRQGADEIQGWRSSKYGPANARQHHEGAGMRPLRYSINVTLDGCCHHEAGLPPDEESMRYWTAAMERADALLFGRVTYQMMESAWRKPATGAWPDWMGERDIPFAEAIDQAKKYVVSSTLDGVDWNADLVRGDLRRAVEQLKAEKGEGLWVGGVTLPLTLTDLGLIDEYEFVVQPILAGHGPTLLAGLRERLELELVGRHEFQSGAVALRYRPSQVTA